MIDLKFKKLKIENETNSFLNLKRIIISKVLLEK